MDNRSPELIEAEMAETRQSLSEKVAALEDSVVGTVQSASTAVKDTVCSVRSTVEDTVEAVKDGVQSALDVSGHVRRHPWPMVGGAAAVGFVAGFILPRAGGTTEKFASPQPASPRPVAARPTSSSPGLWDTLLDRVTAELRRVGETAVEKLSAAIQQVVSEKLPKVVDRLLEPPSHRTEPEVAAYPIGRWNGAAAG